MCSVYNWVCVCVCVCVCVFSKKTEINTSVQKEGYGASFREVFKIFVGYLFLMGFTSLYKRLIRKYSSTSLSQI